MSLVLPKLGRFALGIAASGGIALFLAGSASAASSVDASVSGTGSQTSTVTEVITTDTISTATQAGTVIGDSVSSGASDTQNPVGTPSDDNATAGASGASSGLSATTQTAAVNSEISPLAVGAIGTTSGSVTASQVSQSQVGVVSQATMRRSVLTAITMPQTPVELSAASSAAAIPHKQPDAPKANGLLSALARQLAGTVVPELFHPFTAAAVLPVRSITTSLFISVAILLSLLTFTYSQLLRRGGYATAARSDVASLTFATPHLIDYGLLQPAVVFFGGVRDKNRMYLMTTNVYQKGGE